MEYEALYKLFNVINIITRTDITKPTCSLDHWPQISNSLLLGVILFSYTTAVTEAYVGLNFGGGANTGGPKGFGNWGSVLPRGKKLYKIKKKRCIWCILDVWYCIPK